MFTRTLDTQIQTTLAIFFNLRFDEICNTYTSVLKLHRPRTYSQPMKKNIKLSCVAISKASRPVANPDSRDYIGKNCFVLLQCSPVTTNETGYKRNK